MAATEFAGRQGATVVPCAGVSGADVSRAARGSKAARLLCWGVEAMVDLSVYDNDTVHAAVLELDALGRILERFIIVVGRGNFAAADPAKLASAVDLAARDFSAQLVPGLSTAELVAALQAALSGHICM